MTRLRKLAVKISDTVVCRSLPAYKDWAQATARELEFIESDWAALRWALGSWKMAASCQNAPLASMSEVPRAARNFLRETRVSTVLTWFSLLGTSYWFSIFCGAHYTAGKSAAGMVARHRRHGVYRLRCDRQSGTEIPPRRWVAGGCRYLPIGAGASARPPIRSVVLVSNGNHHARVRDECLSRMADEAVGRSRDYA
jgi:hypothetical protein